MAVRVILPILAIGVLIIPCGCASNTALQKRELEIAALEKEIRSITNDYMTLQWDYNVISKRAAGLEEQLKKNAAEIALLSRERGELAAQITDLKAKLSSLKKENESLASAAKTENLLKTLSSRFAELNGKVNELKSKNSLLQEELTKRSQSATPQVAGPGQKNEQQPITVPR